MFVYCHPRSCIFKKCERIVQGSPRWAFITSFVNHFSEGPCIVIIVLAKLLKQQQLPTGEVLTVEVPAFAESVSEGDLRWIKAVGDQVAEDEPIGEIETDKVQYDYHSLAVLNIQQPMA